MSAQLRHRLSSNLLRPERPVRGLLGVPAPHLLYANLEFGKSDTPRKARSLLSAIGFNEWNEGRVLKYLEKYQAEFRRCLEWLSQGSKTHIEGFEEPEDEPGDKFGNNSIAFSHRMMKLWEQQPEVKFLQQHGLHDAGVILRPAWQDGVFFNGIELGQRKPKDPLDPLCGYLISLLMWDGTVGVCRCAYKKCHKFIRPRTSRKVYCSDPCRASAHMEKKSPEAKAKYMRDYRRLVKNPLHAKKKASQNVIHLQPQQTTKSRPRPV